MTNQRLGMLALAAAVGLGVGACEESAAPAVPETALLSVSPAGGAVEVDPSGPIEVTFDHAMHDHAVDYAAVHEGDVTGPEMAGSWMLEQGGMVMRFYPDEALTGGTEYTIHLGGGMMDADGHVVDLGTHGMSMGGLWATESMMGGGMMGGQDSHMGEGWQHPSNGSYGMVFTFTTGGHASVGPGIRAAPWRGDRCGPDGADRGYVQPRRRLDDGGLRRAPRRRRKRSRGGGRVVPLR